MRDNSMSEVIYDYFESRIQFGYYEWGDRLPSVSYISQQFQVSALTVRTALAKLRDEGMIETTERKAAAVIYQPGKEALRRYTQYFLSRMDGIDDICRFSGLLFDPIAAWYFQKQDGGSLKRIRSRLRKAKGHAARQIINFYALAMQQLNNALALNLYWEVVRYLRIPYIEQPVSFEKTDEQAVAHIQRMLTLLETGNAKNAVVEMRAFNQDVMFRFLRQIHDLYRERKPLEQFPFHWQIYRDRPQICYTLAAEIMSRIDRQLYRQDDFLPSCQSMAQEFGVSLITMRRTLELLGEMKNTTTINGVGTKVVSRASLGFPDFSHPPIRKSLLLFLQAMQISALTFKSVAVHTLTSIDTRRLLELDEQIERQTADGKVFLLGEICLRFVGENSPSPLIREVYSQLHRLLLWGHPLHVFFQQAESGPVYTAYAVQARRRLRGRDIDGFADQISDLLFKVLEYAKNLLTQLGFDKERLID